MAIGANIWAPTTEISGNTKSAAEDFTALQGQSLFTLQSFQYAPNTGAMQVYKNGALLTPTDDWVEQTSTTFSLVAGSNAGDIIVAIANVGIAGDVQVIATDIYLDNYQEIRDYVDFAVQDTIYSKGTTTPGDGGQKFFQYLTGAAPGFYVDDNATVLVPTGGDGSAGWVAEAALYGTQTAVSVLDNLILAVGDLVETAGYNTKGDGGGNIYEIVAGGTGTADGGSFIDLANGLQAKGLFPDGDIRIEQFGARSDDSTPMAEILQATGDYILSLGGGIIMMKTGKFFLGTTPVVFDMTAVSPGVKLGMQGAGPDVTTIRTGLSSGIALHFIGDESGSANAHQPAEIRDFTLTRNQGAVLAETGLKITGYAYASLTNLIIEACYIGLHFRSTLSSEMENCRMQFCGTGVLAEKAGGFSDANAMSFRSCVWRLNTVVGMNVLDNASTLNIVGGSFEANGIIANSTVGGLQVVLSGAAGRVGVNLSDVYFEVNMQGFDVRLDATLAPSPITCSFKGCNFNRVDNIRFVNTNLKLKGNLVLDIFGGSFDGIAPYVEKTSEPYALFEDLLPIVNCWGVGFSGYLPKNIFNKGDQLRLKRSVNQIIPDNIETTMNFDQELTGSLPQLGNYVSGVFTVPVGVNRVSVAAGIEWDTNGSIDEIRQIRIQTVSAQTPNGALVKQNSTSFPAYNTCNAVNTGPVETIQGSTFEVQVLQKTTPSATCSASNLPTTNVLFVIE